MNSRETRLVLNYAKANGISVAKLSQKELRSLLVKVFPKSYPAGGAVAATAAHIEKKMGVRQADPDTIRKNKATCEGCPHGQFARLKDQTPVCQACGCHGKFLEAKWSSSKGECPLTVGGKEVKDLTVEELREDPPTWSNRRAG